MNPAEPLIIGEDGYVTWQDRRITDPLLGQELFKNLKLNPPGYYTTSLQGSFYLVEVFDEPLVAKEIFTHDHDLFLRAPYDLKFQINKNTFCLDFFDRIHGETIDGIPFVLSNKAQNDLFNMTDSFDDDSFHFKGQKILTPSYFKTHLDIESESYWSDIYRENPNPGWNLGAPAPAFLEMTPKLKIPKSRVLVLGSGEGHDAAFFAQEGHIVTAIDFSPEAILKSKKLYGHLPNLNFIEKDIFKIDSSYNETFDLIIEHTCYCAINPDQRSQLISLWNRLLTPKGQLMGIFFTMPKHSGPPFGGSEWELRERMRKKFRFLFWGRWKNSPPQRQHTELFVFAEKLK